MYIAVIAKNEDSTQHKTIFIRNNTYILSRKLPTTSTTHKLTLQHTVHAALEYLPLLGDGLVAHAERFVHEVRACPLAGGGFGIGLCFSRCGGVW